MTGKRTRKNIFYAILALILFGALLFGNPTVVAQETGPIVVISQVNDQNFPRVTARVTVLDQSGLAIDNLDAANFLVWEDNRAVPNVSVMPVPSDQTEPISLVLALDVSGSMDEPDQNGVLKIEAARAEAKSLLDSLGPNDRAAIISFSEAITVEQWFTTDRTALRAAVDGLQLDGDTALNNALFQAADLVGSLPPGKKAIILLTDGLNTYGDLTLDDALDRANRSGVPVYTVGFYTSGIDPALRREAEAALTRIATVTNGRYFAAPTAEELGLAFQTLAQLLRLQYELSFESTLVADGKPHELKVRVSHQGQDGDDFDVFNAYPASPVVVSLDGPAEGDTVSKLISFTPHVAPPVEIVAAEFQVDGDTRATLAAPPFSFEWDATYEAPGPHTLTAFVTDSMGTVHPIERTLTVTPPLALQIMSPSGREEVSGQLETMVEVSGPGAVDRVEFWWNGELLDTVNNAPFTLRIDTNQYLDGEYTLLARAYEVDGYSTEQTITVNVRAVTTNPGLWIALGVGILILALVIPLGIRARRRAIETVPATPIGKGLASPRASTAPAAWLEVVRGAMQGQRFVLSEMETRLGRSRAENDIPVEGRTASRRHATIKVSDGQYVYYDLHPTNPTIINGQEIAGSYELSEGDQIEIGDVILRFTFEEE